MNIAFYIFKISFTALDRNRSPQSMLSTNMFILVPLLSNTLMHFVFVTFLDVTVFVVIFCRLFKAITYIDRMNINL